MEPKCYIALHRDERIWKRSSSGGAFSAITDSWLSHHGEKASIYGCVLDEDLNAVHIRAVTAAERDRMCGSKYIGSNTSGAYRTAAEDLKKGMYVCFSGTPCQIAGLKSFLAVKGIDAGDRLLTVDFICHGVASTRFFQDYISVLEKKYGSKAIACRFRAKSRPERRQDIEVDFANGKTFLSRSTRYDWFYSVYFRNLSLRPSCFRCRYASETRQADITIADHWEFKTLYQKAKSLIIANTSSGKFWAEKSLIHMQWETVAYSEVRQPQLSMSVELPEGYDAFWQTYLEKGYHAAQKLAGNNTLAGRGKYWLVGLADDLHILSTIKKLRVMLHK